MFLEYNVTAINLSNTSLINKDQVHSFHDKTFQAELHGAVAMCLTKSQSLRVRYSVQPLSFLLSIDSRRAVVSYWQKYVHEVLVNLLGGLSLPRKSMVMLTEVPI